MNNISEYISVIIKRPINYLRDDNTYKITIDTEYEKFGETTITINNKVLHIGKVRLFENIDQFQVWAKLNNAELIELTKQYKDEFNKLMNMFEHIVKFDLFNNFISKYIYKFLREVVYNFIRLQTIQLYTFGRFGE